MAEASVHPASLQTAPAGSGSEAPLPALTLWLRHSMCFVVPFTTLGFALTGPHRWYLSLPWFLVVVASVIIDNHAGPERHQPAASLSAWPFDAVLYVLAAIQLASVVLVARLIARAGLWSVDALVAMLLAGVNSGYSGIVVAHELIHRPQRRHQLLGRLILCTVMYEHFFTEHVRGHHARVGTPEDSATARFGESYRRFWRRTVPGQFKSAWRLEAKRLGDETMKWWDPRLLKSRVVHGLVAEWTLAFGILGVFGWAAFVVFLAQALGAVRLLEAVNYFEHWGLQRSRRKVETVDSWDTESWFTLYTLVGLSRHADHHAHATRPYQELRHFADSPKLPRGYFGMVVMVIVRNRTFRKLMTAELERRKLGPFAEAPPAAGRV
jgi:alkane 1-monooxygenase